MEILKSHIEIDLINEFIRPFKSLAGAFILFDRKLNDFLWLYMDYQGLNNLTIKNLYPLPLIRESLDRLGRARRFTQLHFINVYHQMKISKGNKWKTEFRTWYGHFKYQVMLFGLTNASASFQGFFNKILAKKLDIFVIVYLDDIFIYTNDDGNGHVAAICWVLEQFKKFLLFANLKKCWFYQDKIQFFGYVVFSKDIRIEDEKIEAVK